MWPRTGIYNYKTCPYQLCKSMHVLDNGHNTNYDSHCLIFYCYYYHYYYYYAKPPKQTHTHCAVVIHFIVDMKLSSGVGGVSNVQYLNWEKFPVTDQLDFDSSSTIICWSEVSAGGMLLQLLTFFRTINETIVIMMQYLISSYKLGPLASFAIIWKNFSVIFFCNIATTLMESFWTSKCNVCIVIVAFTTTIQPLAEQNESNILNNNEAKHRNFFLQLKCFYRSCIY